MAAATAVAEVRQALVAVVLMAARAVAREVAMLADVEVPRVVVHVAAMAVVAAAQAAADLAAAAMVVAVAVLRVVALGAAEADRAVVVVRRVEEEVDDS